MVTPNRAGPHGYMPFVDDLPWATWPGYMSSGVLVDILPCPERRIQFCGGDVFFVCVFSQAELDVQYRHEACEQLSMP